MALSRIKAANDIPVLEKRPRYKLDQLNPARIARHVASFTPSEQVAAELMAKARLHVPGLTQTHEMLRILHHNPDYVMGLSARGSFDPAHPTGEGLIAFLPLNLLGLQHLMLGTFNAQSPDLRLLAKPGERPAAIYLWLVYAPGALAAGIAFFMERMSSSIYAGLDIYTRPATDAGTHYIEVMGFTQGASLNGIEAPPNVWVFSRKAPLPLYDSYVPGLAPDHVGVTIARSIEDLLRVNAIRSAVYIGEQECPYDEEYDGNDLSGTHLLAYMGDEPVGCIRLRFFADFAKIERLAVRKEFRKSQAAFQLVRAAFKFCQKKGYCRIIAHSQARLTDFWKRFGFHVLEGSKPFVFSDFDYVEMIAELERDPESVAIGTDPYVMIRPEGRWHEPGILEKSAVRQPTRPSVAKSG